MKLSLSALFTLLTLSMILFSGCRKVDEPNTDQDVLSSPVLTASANKDGSALFTWTSGTIKNSELKVNYRLFVGRADEDLFEKGTEYTPGAELSYTIDAEDFSKLLVSYGCASGKSIELKALVSAKAGTTTKMSAEVSFTAALPEAEVVFPSALYMKGGACEGGWDTAVTLAKVNEGIYQVTGTALKFGEEKDGKGMKFFVGEESYPFYGQDKAAGAAFGDVALFANENDGDSQFYPLKSGYKSGIYTINVNLNTMKLSLSRTGDVDEFIASQALYILGDGMDGAWNMSESTALLPKSEGIYEGKNIHLVSTSSFKIFKLDWTEYIRDTAAGDYWTLKLKGNGDGDDRFIPSEANTGFVNGKYTVNVNLNTMKMSISLEESDPDYPLSLYMFGPATSAGWEIEKAIKFTMTETAVYTADVEINVGVAVEGDDKGNGFKFSTANNWGGTEYGAAGNFEQGYRGWGLTKTDLQFYPLLMGLTSKTYKVTVDFNNMTISLE